MVCSRWTAKEAAFKALFPTVKISWKDIQVSKEGGLKPMMALLPRNDAANYEAPRNQFKLHLSVSHDGNYVASVVLAEHG